MISQWFYPSLGLTMIAVLHWHYEFNRPVRSVGALTLIARSLFLSACYHSVCWTSVNTSATLKAPTFLAEPLVLLTAVSLLLLFFVFFSADATPRHWSRHIKSIRNRFATDGIMAGVSDFIWIPLLLSCVFPASDNRHGKDLSSNHLNSKKTYLQFDNNLKLSLISQSDRIGCTISL